MALPEPLHTGERVRIAASPALYGWVCAIWPGGHLVEVHWDDDQPHINHMVPMHWLMRVTKEEAK